MRHDARQPLSAIFMLLGAIDTDEPMSPAVRERLSRIRDQAEDVAAILAASEDGQPDVQAVDLGSVVRGICAAVRATTGSRIRLHAAAEVVVLVNLVALRRTLRNIVENAARAVGSEGTVQVTVSRSEKAAVFEVGDSGPGFGGILPQQGLGLVTVERFVRTFDGTVHIDRASLGGALVTVRLPLATVDTPVGRETA